MLCSVIFPVWVWTKWHWIKFITASYSKDLALESAELSRDLIKSDTFKLVYPEYVIKSDKDTKSNYKIAKIDKNVRGIYPTRLSFSSGIGGNRFSTSVGGTLTGYHADIFIWDDALNPLQAASEKELATANFWIDQTLPTRKTDKDRSVVIGIMQRLHENDPTGHLLKKEKTNLKHICLPGEIASYGQMVKPKGLIKYYKNDLFDPNRLNWKVLEELAIDLGPYGYAGQIGQSPSPAGGGLFHIDNFKMVPFIDKKEIVNIVRFWDKAATQGGGAYTAGVKMARLKNNFFAILDVKRGQWSTDVREKIIRKTAEEDGENVMVLIEQEPGSGGKESAENTIRNLAGFRVRADRPTGDKAQRADPFSVQVNNGNVFMVTGDWNKEYIKELSLFPNSRYKDQTDASSGAFNALATKRTIKRIT
jgi:predicted phage terminase large subunit-like protein